MIESHKLYHDTIELKFDPFKHLYTVNEIPVDGVTTVVRVIDKSGPLIYWAVGEAMKKVREVLRPGVSLDELEIEQLIEDASKQHRVRKKSAADFGTMAHDWIHQYLEGKNPPTPINKALKHATDSFLEWQAREGVTFSFTEKKVYSKKYNYAGTLDGIMTRNGNLGVMDIKTGKSIYDEYRFQLSAYKEAMEEEYPALSITERWILRLGKEPNKDGELDFEPVLLNDHEKDFKAFLGCIVIHRRLKQLKGMDSPIGVGLTKE